MGQQQLILLVLATVIVGIAIVVGIAAFTENSAKANADAMMQDAVRMANDAQAWKKKPAPFGGQSSLAACAAAACATAEDFTGATLPLLGYATNADDEYVNLNGSYTVAASDAGVIITGTNAIEGNEIVVAVCGMTDADIDGIVVDLGGNEDIGTAPTCA